MRRPLMLLTLAVLLAAGCVHGKIERDAFRFFNAEPEVKEPPPDAAQRERDLYNTAKRLERKVEDKDRECRKLKDEKDDLKDEIKDLKKRLDRREDEIKDLRKTLGRTRRYDD